MRDAPMRRCCTLLLVTLLLGGCVDDRQAPPSVEQPTQTATTSTNSASEVEPAKPGILGLHRYSHAAATNYVITTLLDHDDAKRWGQQAAAYRNIYGDDESLGLLVALAEQAEFKSKTERANACAAVVRETYGIAGFDADQLKSTYAFAEHLREAMKPDATPLTAGALADLDAWADRTIGKIVGSSYNVYDPVERHMGNAEDYLLAALIDWQTHRGRAVPEAAIRYARTRIPLAELHAPELEAALKSTQP